MRSVLDNADTARDVEDRIALAVPVSRSPSFYEVDTAGPPGARGREAKWTG